MTEQEQIDAYRRMESFLADPAVKRAFQNVKDFIFGRFENAVDSEQAEDAWRMSRALTLVSTQLMRVIDDGKIAVQQQEHRELQERARNARAPRKQ